jgi:hypothetical protein
MTAARAPDSSKSQVVVEIRDRVAKLSPLSLRRLKENLFALQLKLVDDMITDGVDVLRVQALSHCSRAIEVVDSLSAGARERQVRG